MEADTHGPAYLAHHFDDPQQQYDAATLGMWCFLVTEVLFFSGMFAGYAVYRARYPEAFATGSLQLDVWLGTLNTGLLLLSSLTMALAVRGAQTGSRNGLLGCLIVTMLLGSGFLTVKGIEYAHKFREHLVPGPQFELSAAPGQSPVPPNAELFFSFYFAMTGIHTLHMLIGIVVLAVLLVLARRGQFSPEYYTPVEMSGLYWHFVDIVWVFLFPLLYLIDIHR